MKTRFFAGGLITGMLLFLGAASATPLTIDGKVRYLSGWTIFGSVGFSG